MTKGEIIKKLRKEHDLTLDELAEKLETTRQTIFKYENNIVTNIPSDKIELLAKCFRVSPAYIMGWENNENNKTIYHNVTNIPLYSSISCGTGMFVDDDIEDYIAVPDKYLKPGREYFANTASGDSMIGKGIKEGDVLVFEKSNVVENGQIGAFCVDESQAVCKTYRSLPNGMIMLESANEKYDPIIVDLAEECFRVIGLYKFKFSVEQ